MRFKNDSIEAILELERQRTGNYARETEDEEEPREYSGIIYEDEE